MIKIVKTPHTRNPEVLKITGRGLQINHRVFPVVQKILRDIRTKGQAAVVAYAQKYEGTTRNLKVPLREIDSQAKKCPLGLKRAINTSLKNVHQFHLKQKEVSWKFPAGGGSTLGQIIRPLKRVGIYVPGGSGTYPSTVIMNAVPARVAGVEEIVGVTPAPGPLRPVLAYAFKKLKITEVYRVGGAQAIGMLAYGTEKVTRVDKIVGPGNSYVAAAKKEVFGQVDIDMVAGPSEILVLADDSADPDWVAADLLSQAEHGSGDEAAILITPSYRLALFVQECVKIQVENSPKKDLLRRCLKKYGRIFVVPNLEMGCDLANLIAPEHMEIMTKQSSQIAAKIKNAGALFLGPYSSEPVGDYMAGPNHVLPTSGSARFFSPLGVYDFYKRTSYIEYSQASMRKISQELMDLAEAEGFIHHAEAVRRRL